MQNRRQSLLGRRNGRPQRPNKDGPVAYARPDDRDKQPKRPNVSPQREVKWVNICSGRKRRERENGTGKALAHPKIENQTNTPDLHQRQHQRRDHQQISRDNLGNSGERSQPKMGTAPQICSTSGTGHVQLRPGDQLPNPSAKDRGWCPQRRTGEHSANDKGHLLFKKGQGETWRNNAKG